MTSLPVAAIGVLPAFVAVGLGLAEKAYGAGTAAGSLIANVATATYDDPAGGTASVTSNTVTLKVDELLDASVTGSDPGDIAANAGATNAVLTFRLTNAGNGTEAFRLSAVSTVGGDDFDPAVTAIHLDANGNDQYDAGVDTLYSAGANDPVLAADGSLSIFIVSTIPGSAADASRGKVQLIASATTGTGAPGTTLAGQGDGGGDAIVGATGAQGQDDGGYLVAAAALGFTKTASISDPFGGTEPVPGAIITYTLTASVSGSGLLNALRITDPVPAATSYIANSIKLDGNGQSDAADGDAGNLSNNVVTVDLGTVNGGTTRVVTFQVRIN